MQNFAKSIFVFDKKLMVICLEKVKILRNDFPISLESLSLLLIYIPPKFPQLIFYIIRLKFCFLNN